MGNDNAYKIIRIGTIHLKTHDGLTKVLINFWYVPSLKKNLISLGALESKGLTVIMRSGVLKVVSDTFLVMKGIISNKLYYLQGSTLMGATTTISTEDVDLKATRLWNIHMGHVVQKALHNLINQGLLKGENLEFANILY